jgi:ubiquinone/menaquinone biosynthesis C-methylase UbiE
MGKDNFGNVEHYYLNYYHKMIGFKSKGLSRKLSDYPHRLMESRFKSNESMNILEVGVGDFEHLKFVAHDFKKYTGVDNREPNNAQYSFDGKVEFINSDAHELPFEDEIFDRVIVTCLIVHLANPEKAIDEWLRVLKKNGSLIMYIALEPSIFLQLLRKFYMKKKAFNLGFDGYDLFIARDHITYGLRIINILNEKFKSKVKLVYRPFPVPLWFLNAFCVAKIEK